MSDDSRFTKPRNMRLFRAGRLPFIPVLPSPLSLTVERLILGVFVLGLMVVGTLGVLAYQSSRALGNVTESVSQSRERLKAMDELLARLYQIESVQRSYLLTGTLSDRNRYAALAGAVDREVLQLRELMSSDSALVRQVDALREPIARRLALLDEGLRVRDAGGLLAAAARVQAGAGAALMAQIRDGVDALARAEAANLAQRRAAAAQRARATETVIVIALLGALLMAIAASWLILRQLRIRRRAETAAARLAALVEESEDAIIGTTTDGRIVSWNRGAEEIYGYPEVQAVGMAIDLLIPDHERGHWEEVMERLRRGEPVDHFEATGIRKSGQAVPVSLGISPVRDEDGHLIGAAAIARDITETKRSAAALAALNRWQAAILEGAGEGIFGLDREGRITFVNPSAAEQLKRSADELVGRDCHSLLRPMEEDGSELNAESCPICSSHRQGGGRSEGETMFMQRDGSRFPVRFTASPLREEDRVTGAVVTFQDITERREVERLKEEFISVVSHELRTPLTAIRGALGLVASGAMGELPARAGRMMSVAAENTDRLVRLINDILDVERIASGTATTEPEWVNSATLMSVAEELMQPMAQKADVSLTVHPLEARVYADPDRMVQVFTNLLGNAIKFSPPGASVLFEGERQRDEVCFRVIDKGRSIPADQLETIFGRFQQVDASDSRQKGGTGLGLAISRGIVDQHRGRMWAESEPGEGSTFMVVLPAEPEARQETEPPPVRILLCDDDAAVRELVSRMLRRRGYQVAAVATGGEAILRAERDAPDLILMDLGLPKPDGREVLAALKANPATDGIPVIIFSGQTPDPAVQEMGLADAWVEKGDARRLLDALALVLPTNGGPRILVVEDDATLLDVLVAMLESRGFRVSSAATVAGALEEATRHPPHVIVLDLALPDEDGFELLNQLRDRASLEATAIFVYTARDLSEEDRTRLSLAPERLFTKGRVSPEDLVDRIDDLLNSAEVG